MKTIKLWLCILLVLISCTPASALRETASLYTLEHHLRRGHITLRLFNHANRRTVWRKQVAELDCIGWSPDHKALAVSALVSGKTPFRLLLWQEGRPLRLLDDSPMSEGGYIDGVIDFAWSPDDRRVLYRVYQSGGKMMNDGDLYCVDTRTWRIILLARGVRRLKWLRPHQIEYHVMKFEVHGGRVRLVEDIHSRFITLP